VQARIIKKKNRTHERVPLQTRAAAAALKSKNNDIEKVLIRNSNKNKKKSHSKRQPKEQFEQQLLEFHDKQLSENGIPPKDHDDLEPSSSSLKTESVNRIHSPIQNLAEDEEDDLCISISSLFNEEEVTSSTTDEKKIAKETDHSELSVLLSQDNDILLDDSNVGMNSPVVGGDITYGTSTRGGKIIHMNSYGYIFLIENKKCIGWRCVKRNEQCKAVIYTSKSTGLFSHWNGKYHCHPVDLCDTRKRQIL